MSTDRPAGAPGGRPGAAGTPAGLSLVEVLVTVTVIGILCAVAIGVFGGAADAARETVAFENAERLNLGVRKVEQIDAPLTVPPVGGSAADEQEVLAALQVRDPLSRPGSPFVPPGVSLPSSSTASVYRLEWNGRSFEVLRPGEDGAGLGILF